MAFHALRKTPRRLRPDTPQPTRRFRDSVKEQGLVSVAGVVGSPVFDRDGTRSCRLADIVVRWTECSTHPLVVGALVHVGRRPSFVGVETIERLDRDRVALSGLFTGSAPQRDAGLVALNHDVVDRQLVDAHGVNVVRVSDLVLARASDGLRLVGVDVSVRTLLRRLGPAPVRRHVAHGRLYDWATVAAFGVRGGGDAGIHTAANRGRGAAV
jgi:hypothetical protein